MALHGLDRDGAPDPGLAKKMLEDIGGTWWNVYMGGPESGGSGWTPGLLSQYKDHGITHFLLSYVGRQEPHVSRLTESQGQADGAEACQLAAQFGFAAAGTPVCLDLEGRTFDAAQGASLDYADGWCNAVRAHGFRPGVYSNPRALIPLHDRANRPDWVWVASWIEHTADSGTDPHKATGMPDGLWPKTGQRAWQYAGTFDNVTCSIRGLSVDIDVADSGVLVSSGAVTGQTGDPGHHPLLVAPEPFNEDHLRHLWHIVHTGAADQHQRQLQRLWIDYFAALAMKPNPDAHEHHVLTFAQHVLHVELA
jgi:hypothetical protein